MPKITITREIEVPDGPYCEKDGDPCESFLHDNFGMYCEAFGQRIDQAGFDDPMPMKCPQCLEACERAGG